MYEKNAKLNNVYAEKYFSKTIIYTSKYFQYVCIIIQSRTKIR